MRDNFSITDKEILAKRVGYKCSNPGCCNPTSGPQSNSQKAINIGVAAHIKAASIGGKRYDPSQTPRQRKSMENAIWLCQNCAKLIDNDEIRYTVKLIKSWKKKSEQRALLELEGINEQPKWRTPILDNDFLYTEDEEEQKVIIKYFLKEKEKNNLYCELSNENSKVEFSLQYYIEPLLWKENNNECPWQDPYCYTLMDLSDFINTKYDELDNNNSLNILSEIKFEIQTILKKGIENLAKELFNLENSKDNVPSYDKFIEAFEHHTGLKRDSYKAQVVGGSIHFITQSGDYIMDSYEGKTALIKSFIERRSYSEIYTETSLNIWSEIYLDAGIDKSKFIPTMLYEWEKYWDDLYIRIKKDVGSTSHLDKMKEQSWRQFQAFSDAYNDAGDIIELAYEFNDSELYPIAIISMMNIFDPDVCYQEYCEMEFYAYYEYKWDSIWVNEHDENCPILFIRDSDY